MLVLPGISSLNYKRHCEYTHLVSSTVFSLFPSTGTKRGSRVLSVEGLVAKEKQAMHNKIATLDRSIITSFTYLRSVESTYNDHSNISHLSTVIQTHSFIYISLLATYYWLTVNVSCLQCHSNTTHAHTQSEPDKNNNPKLRSS
jgi:hypothetical protein